MTRKKGTDETPESLARAAIEAALATSDAPLVAASEMLLDALKDHPEWREFIERLSQGEPPRNAAPTDSPAIENDLGSAG
ncbi:MAG: hypothetical protein AB7N24_20435 [Dehalococcoidia bacterium]